MEKSGSVIAFRIFVFLAALFYLIVVSVTPASNGDPAWQGPGGPLRYLTIWALVGSSFIAFRVLLISLGRSDKRFDALVAAFAVVNAMVVFLYWRLFFADPNNVRQDGELGVWWREYYLHGLGPLLMWIDAFFLNRAFVHVKSAFVWLIGIVLVYIAWAELFVGPLNDEPIGRVTSGLHYPFLNNLEFAGRAEFYGTNLIVAAVLLGVFAAFARGVRRAGFSLHPA